MDKYKIFQCLLRDNEENYIINSVIDDYRTMGYVYCDNRNEYDEFGFCFVYLIFTKESRN